MKTFKYSQKTNRDLRLDFLRGLCLFIMLITHTGLTNYLSPFTGDSMFLISGAEGFFFISGFTLGIISVGKDLKTITTRLIKRIWAIYLSSVGITFFFVTMLIKTDLEISRIKDLTIDSHSQFWSLIVDVFSLQFKIEGPTILNLYIIFLAASILIFWGLLNHKDALVIFCISVLYAFAQFKPELTELPIYTFRHAVANLPIFFTVLFIGYRKERVNEIWEKINYKKFLDIIIIILGLALLILFNDGFSSWPWLGEKIVGIKKIRSWIMPIQNLMVVFIYIRIFWIITTEIWELMIRIYGWIFIPMGQASLFTFLIHFFFLIFFWNYPLSWRIDTATLLILAYIAIILIITILRKQIMKMASLSEAYLNFTIKNFPLLSTIASFMLFLFYSLSEI
jgi:hypothetical protein